MCLCSSSPFALRTFTSLLLSNDWSQLIRDGLLLWHTHNLYYYVFTLKRINTVLSCLQMQSCFGIIFSLPEHVCVCVCMSVCVCVFVFCCSAGSVRG